MCTKIVVLLLCAVGYLGTGSAADVSGLTIIRGVDVKPHKVPYMVQIALVNKTGQTFGCGGTLVHPQFVLTAAHCLLPPNIRSSKVHLGCHLTNRTDCDQVIDYSDFQVHVGYTAGVASHDIGILKLSRAAVLKPDLVELAPLADRSTIPAGRGLYDSRKATVFGWGYAEGGRLPGVLQRLDGRIASQEQASNAADCASVLTLCLGRSDGTTGVTCSGDSGGPLVRKRVQIGVMSSGSVDCDNGVFSIFVRVDFFRKWIDDYVSTHQDRASATS